MYLFIAKNGQVTAVHKREDLKTPYKYAGWEGCAFEVSGSPVPLEDFKPKPPAGQVVAQSSVSADVKALMDQNASLMAQLAALMAAVKPTAEKAVTPPAPAAPPQ